MAGQIFHIPGPVAVITTKYKNKVNGMTAAWVAQASFNPPLIMVSIAPERYTHELIQNSKILAVNVLSAMQIKIAKHFGFTSGKNIDKFESVIYEIKKTGAPIIKDIYAYFDCHILSAVRAGDHTIFIAEVQESRVDNTKTPLIFNTRDFF